MKKTITKAKIHLQRSPRTVACGLTTPGKSETTKKVSQVTCGRCKQTAEAPYYQKVMKTEGVRA